MHAFPGQKPKPITPQSATDPLVVLISLSVKPIVTCLSAVPAAKNVISESALYLFRSLLNAAGGKFIGALTVTFG
ncbi:hypothetical protein D3C78_1419210 [compost metagenome]